MGFQPWEDVPRESHQGGRVPGIIPKDNVRRKRLDGVSEAHEALPDTKVCGNARPESEMQAVTASDGMALKVL
jgi:hypothetical protein